MSFAPSILAVAEPESTALLLLVLGTLVGASVLLSRLVDRVGVPIVLLFLVLGMIGGSEGLGGIAFDDNHFAVRIGTAALILILFDGGLSTSYTAVRQAWAPATALATVGVLITGGIIAVAAHWIGLTWGAALLLGAVVSSTDAAAVFSVLRAGRLHLRPRLGHTLELESCINDPMAVILTLAVIDALLGARVSLAALLIDVPVQLIVGVGVGTTIGLLLTRLLRRVRLGTVGLYPMFTLALALMSYGAATMLHGSGFLAVFTTGVVLGNARLPFRTAMLRVHNAFAWLGQVSMFLMLGLLVYPSQLPAVALQGLILALLLAAIARPAAALICLLPFKFTMTEIGYVGWNGLRGAVPIVLALFPVLAHVPGAQRVFNLVFFIVVINSLLPGATIRWLTLRLGMTIPTEPPPSAALEINSLHALNGELTSYLVHENVLVCGMNLSEIEFPDGSSVVMIVRGRDLIAARGRTRIEPGDHVYVFHLLSEKPLLDLLFGRPESE